MALVVNQKPCWEVSCDRCGEGDNGEYGGSFHYDSEAAARQSITDQDWLIREDGRALCGACLDTPEDFVACPTCGADVGSQCADPHGGRLLRPCHERVDAALVALPPLDEMQQPLKDDAEEAR